MDCYLITSIDYDPYDPPRTYIVGIATSKEDLTDILISLKKNNSHFLDTGKFGTHLKVSKIQPNQHYDMYCGFDIDDNMVPREELMELINSYTPKLNVAKNKLK